MRAEHETEHSEGDENEDGDDDDDDDPEGGAGAERVVDDEPEADDEPVDGEEYEEEEEEDEEEDINPNLHDELGVYTFLIRSTRTVDVLYTVLVFLFLNNSSINDILRMSFLPALPVELYVQHCGPAHPSERTTG